MMSDADERAHTQILYGIVLPYNATSCVLANTQREACATNLQSNLVLEPFA